jgi:hypothetical protein
MRFLPLLLISACLNTGMTCGTGMTSATETPALPGTMKEIFSECRRLATREGFEEEQADPATGYYRSEWKLEHGVLMQQMKRERLWIHMNQKPDGIVVSIEIEQQVNDNSADPGQASKAIWMTVGNNESLQIRFRMLLKMKFLPEEIQ